MTTPLTIAETLECAADREAQQYFEALDYAYERLPDVAPSPLPVAIVRMPWWKRILRVCRVRCGEVKL